VLGISLVPPAIARLRTERRDIIHEHARTKEINLLAATIGAIGGYRHVLDCGRPTTNVGYVSILAWITHRNIGVLGHRPKFELRQKYPVVLFTQLKNGWAVTPYHIPASQQSSCRGLRALFVATPHRPNGILSHR
jgi:hypothetical protein